MAVIAKSVITSASPETVFRIYQDVERWHLWDPDTRSAKLASGLTLHSKGHLTPTKGNTVPMEVTSIRENRQFTVSSKTALFRMDFDHELEPMTAGTRITHRVTFSGLLKPMLVLVVGRQVERGLPITLENLKRCAEGTEAERA